MDLCEGAEPSERVVSTEEAETFSQQHAGGAHYFETSAKEDSGVTEMMAHIFEETYQAYRGRNPLEKSMARKQESFKLIPDRHTEAN